jgi:hypothetical protein
MHYGLSLNRFAEYAQEIPAADLSDLIRGEARFKHRIDNNVVEPRRLILPCLIGALPDARMLLTVARAVRTAAGLGELGIRADANMIHPDDFDPRPDIPRISNGVSARCVQTPTKPPASATILACSLLMSLGRISCAMDGLLPN